MSGMPVGDPQWPRGRCRLEMPAKLVAMVDLFKAEYRHVRRSKEPRDDGKALRQARRQRKK